MSIFLVALYAILVIYLRVKLLPEYYQFKAKVYLQQQNKDKLIKNTKKTDVTLFFTKQNYINSSQK